MMKLTPAASSSIAALDVAPTARVTLGVSKIACDSFAGYKIANRQNIAMTEFCDGKCADTIIDT